jgi:hypothetical protein
MAIMQGADTWFWFWLAQLLIVALSLATWYYTIIGRDRTPRKQRRGEETIERYGSIEEDRAPLPKFLIWSYIGLGIWVIAYAVWTGIEGIGI